MYVAAHQTVWGNPTHDDDEVWAELDKLLLQRWRHPGGGMLRVDAAVVDAGDGGVYDIVLRFCNARMSRRILAGKGASGFGRPLIQASKTKRGRLFIIGVDNAKAQILTRLSRGTSIRFSSTLDATYFEQLASERRVVRMTRGRPVARFERKIGARAEALDSLVYSLAAKAALSLSAAAFDQREDALRAPAGAPAPAPAPTAIKSKWVTGRAPSWERYS